MASLRIGLIGAGDNTRQRHIPGLRAIEGVEIVSLVNRSPESGQRVADEFEIPNVAPTVEALLADDTIDAICIGTWPNTHRDFTVAALEAGKHVLCEARMAGNARDAEKMLEVAGTHASQVAQLVPAPFDFRLGPTIQRLVREGELGEIREAHVRMLNGAGLDTDAPLHWRHRRDQSGHNVMMLGIFNEMLQRWLGDTTQALAHARTFVKARRDTEAEREVEIEIPDSLSVSAGMANGARATYTFSAVAGGPPVTEVSLYGTKASLHWQFGDTVQWGVHGEDLQELEPDPDTDRGWQVEADFVHSIRDGAPVTLTSFRDGVRYMRFVDAAWASWHEGRLIEIVPLAGAE